MSLDSSCSYKRVLIKISGEALASSSPSLEAYKAGIDQDQLSKVAKNIKQLCESDIQVAIVIGGGNIYRGESNALKNNIDRPTADKMGMLSTVINGLALSHALEDIKISSVVMSALPMPSVAPFFCSKKAISCLANHQVVISVGGTGNPYFTTDTAAVLRSLEMKCDILLKATKVRGVYTKDPALYKDAVFLPQLTYDEVLLHRYRIMDQTAFALLYENNLPLLIFSLYEENAMLSALKGNHNGTYITS